MPHLRLVHLSTDCAAVAGLLGLIAAHGVERVRQRVLAQREQVAQLLRAHQVGGQAAVGAAAAAAAAAGVLAGVVDNRLQALLGHLPLEHLRRDAGCHASLALTYTWALLPLPPASLPELLTTVCRPSLDICRWNICAGTQAVMRAR